MKTSHFRARRARVARQWELRRQLLAGTFDAQKAKDRKHCRQRLADAREQFQSVDQLRWWCDLLFVRSPSQQGFPGPPKIA